MLHHFQRTDLTPPERSVTLTDLATISRELPLLCRGWEDAVTGEKLLENDVNLYHFSYHYILPKTAPRDGFLLRLEPTSQFDLPQVGEEVHQILPEMALPRARGVITSIARENDQVNIQVNLLQGLLHNKRT